MEGRTRRNRLTREQAIRVVLWLERNRETLKTHQATFSKAAEMATDALPMQRRDAKTERIEITAATIKKMLVADPSLDWRTSEPLTTDRALVAIARNLLAAMNHADLTACSDLVRLANDEAVILPQPHQHAAGNNGRTRNLFAETEV